MYNLIVAKNYETITIYFSPKDLRCFCSPHDLPEYERANTFVIRKEDGKLFSDTDLNRINKQLEIPQNRFDLTQYEIVSIQIDVNAPIEYEDYLKQKFILPVTVRSNLDQTDKLLHYLYKEVS